MAKKITDTKVKKVERMEKVAPRYDAEYQANKNKESASDRYKRERDEKAAKRSSARGGGSGPARDKKKKHKDRMAMMKETTDRIRARRSEMNEQLPKFGGK